MKPLSDQIACAERELALRRRNYPRWVAGRRMTEGTAKHEIECMESILESLKNQGQQQLNFSTWIEKGGPLPI